MKYLNKILKALKPKTRYELEQEFYSQATDLTDLERRMKLVQNSRMFEWY